MVENLPDVSNPLTVIKLSVILSGPRHGETGLQAYTDSKRPDQLVLIE